MELMLPLSRSLGCSLLMNYGEEGQMDYLVCLIIILVILVVLLKE